jgi:hypothetical protein
MTDPDNTTLPLLVVVETPLSSTLVLPPKPYITQSMTALNNTAAAAARCYRDADFINLCIAIEAIQ